MTFWELVKQFYPGIVLVWIILFGIVSMLFSHEISSVWRRVGIVTLASGLCFVLAIWQIMRPAIETISTGVFVTIVLAVILAGIVAMIEFMTEWVGL